ncbi:hypothetical protein [Chondromyces crocatus]|uniref:Uncharacterized protein n=1 Tax=Chondromyces crocatus TaxID=52 RepID=A0A0K1E839_CHOCO|nr:hypothetical protein [Chondromyces crocatus]AKT37046.1 uncharacterized protein CMC5_011720 [Chondromyces crocatus]
MPADIDFWLGGGSSMLVAAERYPTGTGPESFSAHAQAEIAFRMESGPWYVRVDFDVQLASNDSIKPLGGFWSSPPWSELEPGFKIGPPEWAMVQYSLDKLRIRGGIVTSMIGLEDWDPWVNPFPTRSLNYNVTPGRTVGLELAWAFDNGYEIFAFGGCDLDWADCFPHDFDGDGVNEIEAWAGMKAGFGITTLQEHFSTWSGFSAMPNLKFYGFNINLEFYPHEYLTIDIEAAPSLIGSFEEATLDKYYFNLITGVTLNVLPSEPIHPMFRIHGAIDPDNRSLWGYYPAYDGIVPDIVASAGVSAAIFDGFKVGLEAKVSRYNFGTVPGLYTGVSFARPEPPPYSARYEEEGEEAAETPAEAARRARAAATAARRPRPLSTASPFGQSAGRSMATRYR